MDMMSNMQDRMVMRIIHFVCIIHVWALFVHMSCYCSVGCLFSWLFVCVVVDDVVNYVGWCLCGCFEC